MTTLSAFRVHEELGRLYIVSELDSLALVPPLFLCQRVFLAQENKK